MQRYAIQASDYGAAVGWRLAVAHPERITAIVTHNSNTYEEGLSEGWNPIEKYWKEPSEVNRKAPCEFLRPESIKWQYTHGVADQERVAPKAYTLDSALISRPDHDETQLDLFLDYASNVARYPEFQAYFREYIRRCWRHRESTIPSSCRQAPKRSMSSAITRATRPRLEYPKVLSSGVGRPKRQLLWQSNRPNPEYWQLAGAFGGHGERVTNPESLEPAIQRALAAIGGGQFAVLDVH